MKLSLREINELIYCIDVARKYGQLLGTTTADKLAVRLRNELDSQLEPDYFTTLSETDSEIFFNKLNDELSEPNEFLKQAAEKYSNESIGCSPNGATQAILDYVEFMGEVTYTEMHDFYKWRFGSNSFSHMLRSLIIPYKNRPTRRFLCKTALGTYVVRIAREHNWVVIEN